MGTTESVHFVDPGLGGFDGVEASAEEVAGDVEEGGVDVDGVAVEVLE